MFNKRFLIMGIMVLFSVSAYAQVTLATFIANYDSYSTIEKERYSNEYIISSFDEAYTVFQKLFSKETNYHVLLNPSTVMNEPFCMSLKVLQSIGEDKYILVGSTGYDNYYFVGKIAKKFKGNKTFFDNQRVTIIGEITGKAEYNTVLGSKKTVPEINIIAIK